MFAVLSVLLATQSADYKAAERLVTGGVFMEWCGHLESPAYHKKAAWCAAYIQGFADALALNPSPICLPNGVPYNEHALVVLRYLRNHPQSLNRHRSVLTQEALIAAYPCRREK